MIKLFIIALTVSAVALSTSFAGCEGGSCTGGKKDSKKDGEPTKDQAARVIEL